MRGKSLTTNSLQSEWLSDIRSSIARGRNSTLLVSAFAVLALACVPASSQESAPAKRTSIQVEVITISRFGLEPAEITRPKGRFILAIENRSNEELDIQLSAEGGKAVKSARLHFDHPDSGDLLDLRPGTYLLSEPNHPRFRGKITITQ